MIIKFGDGDPDPHHFGLPDSGSKKSAKIIVRIRIHFFTRPIKDPHQANTDPHHCILESCLHWSLIVQLTRPELNFRIRTIFITKSLLFLQQSLTRIFIFSHKFLISTTKSYIGTVTRFGNSVADPFYFDRDPWIRSWVSDPALYLT